MTHSNPPLLGKLILETSRGDEKVRRLSEGETAAIRQQISARLTPAIERIRQEHRQAYRHF